MRNRKKAMSIGFNLILTAIVGFSFIIIGFRFYSYLNQNATAKVNHEIISYLKQTMFNPSLYKSSSRIFSLPSQISYALSKNKISVGSRILESYVPVYSPKRFKSSKISVYLSDFSPAYYVSQMLFLYPTNAYHIYIYKTATTANNTLRDEIYNSLPPKSDLSNEHFLDKKEISSSTPLNYNAKTDKTVFVFLSSDSSSSMMNNLIPVNNPNLLVLNISPSKDYSIGNITFYYYNMTSRSSEKITYPYLSVAMVTSAAFSFEPDVYKKSTAFMMKRMLNVNLVYLKRFKIINNSLDKKCHHVIAINFNSNPYLKINKSINLVIERFDYQNMYHLYSNLAMLTKGSNNLIYSGCPSII